MVRAVRSSMVVDVRAEPPRLAGVPSFFLARLDMIDNVLSCGFIDAILLY